MSRTYSEGEKSSACFEEAVSAKSCICSFLFGRVFHVFVWHPFRATNLVSSEVGRDQIYMLYAKCICCTHAQPLARYRFSLHCEPVLRRTVPACRFKPYHASTVPRSRIVFTLPPPLLHAVLRQNHSRSLV